MGLMEAYDNSPRLLYDMECYGVDMCVLEPAFGMTNETNVMQMQKYPDKFVLNCWPLKTREKIQKGEIEAGRAIDASYEELEELLKTGNFVGIGECKARRPI